MSGKETEKKPRNYVGDEEPEDEKKPESLNELEKEEFESTDESPKNSAKTGESRDSNGDKEVKERAISFIEELEGEKKEDEMKERAIALMEEIEAEEKSEKEDGKKEEEARVWGSLSSIQKKPSLMQRLKEARELERQKKEIEKQKQEKLLGKKREQRYEEQKKPESVLVVFNVDLVIVNIYVKDVKLILGEDEERNPIFCTLNWFGHAIHLQRDTEEGITQDTNLVSDSENNNEENVEEDSMFGEWKRQRELKHIPSVSETIAKNTSERFSRSEKTVISEDALRNFGPSCTMVKRFVQGPQSMVVMDIGRDTPNDSTLHIGSERVIVNFIRPGFSANVTVNYEKRIRGDGEQDERTEIRERTFGIGDDGSSSGYYNDGLDRVLETY